MTYDAFLSHNSNDREAVEQIAHQLLSSGLSLFVDRWQLRPGDPWQESLEVALELSNACLVFVGHSGLGPWEMEEMRVAIDKRTHNPSFRVIPVFLPGLDHSFALPPFLRRFHGVIFRSPSDPAALGQLVAVLKTPISPGRQSPGQLRRHLICLSGPSAVGKDILLHRLLHRFRTAGFSCGYLRKYTTRPRRSEEEELKPFAYLTEDVFHSLHSKGSIGCRRYSYGNWYGIDATMQQGITAEELLFVSQRLYKEITELRDLASSLCLDLFTVLVKADRRSLIARSLHRSLSLEQRTRRMAQVLDDLDFLDADPTVAPLFDFVADNSDTVPIRNTEEEIWQSLSNWLSVKKAGPDSLSPLVGGVA